MSLPSKVVVHIWVDTACRNPSVRSVEVPSDTKARLLETVLRQQLRWGSQSSFELFTASHPIPIPKPSNTTNMVKVLESLPDDLSLDPFPSEWDEDINLEFLGDKNELRLVAIDCTERPVNIFETRSGRVRKETHHPMDVIQMYCKCALMPPRQLPTASNQEQADLLELLQGLTIPEAENRLAVVEPPRTLLDLYSLWPGRAVDLVDNSPAASNPSEEADTLAPLKPNDSFKLGVTRHRRKFFKNYPPTSPSSEASGKNPLTTRINQQLAGRLADPTNPAPPSLYDKTLCQLRHDIHHIEPSTEDFADFSELRKAMVKTYTEEAGRKRAFHDAAASFLSEPPMATEIGQYRTDGTLYTAYRDLNLLYLIIEVKNEVGVSRAEPGVQIGRYYFEYLRETLQRKEDYSHCAFPVILICQFGPYMSILVGTAAGPGAEPVTEQIACIALNTELTNQAEILAGARIVSALRVASADLKQRYRDLISNTNFQVQFPYPRTFKDESGEHVPFTYIRPETAKRVYHAQLDDKIGADGKKIPICVKFSLRYSKEAHEAAYDAGYAPKLLGVERVGDWFMIVMEDVSKDHVTLEVLKYQDDTSNDEMVQIRDRLRKCFDNLHTQRFVHGDIRPVNVLVRKVADVEESKRIDSILLIDFDWAGREDDVSYPHNINPEIARLDGAIAGARILSSHDTWMLTRF